jgi:hypothetical protein
MSETCRVIYRINLRSSASHCRSQWSRGIRRRSATARLLRSWVRIPRGHGCLSVVECCALSGRGLCDELITRPEESYRLWSVVVCNLENLKNKEAMTRVGSQRHSKKIVHLVVLHYKSKFAPIHDMKEYRGGGVQLSS